MGFNTLYSNSFQGANESPLSDGGKWTVSVNGGLKILSAQCVQVNSGGGDEYFSGTTDFSSDVWVSLKLNAFPSSVGTSFDLWVRRNQSNNDGYHFSLFWSGSSFQGTLYANGVTTILQNAPGLTVNVGDVFRLSAIGTQITVTQNGSTLSGFSVTDSTSNFDGTIQLGVAGGAAVINFAAGNFQPDISGSLGAAGAGATVRYNGPSGSGTVTADGSGNYTVPNLSNGNWVITPSLNGHFFTPYSQVVTISNSASVTGVNFTTGSSIGWSPVDSRANPNAGVAQPSGALFYTGQSSSNASVPGVDSRAGGAPTDSRAAGPPVNTRKNPNP